MKRWLTEFGGDGGGDLFAGPIVLADCRDEALAMLSCLTDPGGRPLRLIGELVQQIPADEGQVHSFVRRQVC